MLVGHLRREAFAELAARFLPDAKGRARREGDLPVAGAVGEQRRAEDIALAGDDLLGLKRGDVVRAGHDGARGLGVQIDGQVRDVLDHQVDGVGPVRRPGPEAALGDLLADAGLAEPRAVRAGAAGADLDLLARVAAEARPVLEQRRLQAEPRRLHRRADAAVAGAGDHEVEGQRLRRLFAEEAFPHRREGRDIVRRREVLVGGEDQRVAAAVVARQVVQFDFRVALRERERAAFDPAPALFLLAERRRARLPVEEHLEPAGRGRVPVLAAHPEVIFARLRDGHLGRRVGDRFARARGEQVGRAHQQPELRIDGPAAHVVEPFRLEIDRRRPARGGRRQQQARRKQSLEQTHIAFLSPLPRCAARAT